MGCGCQDAKPSSDPTAAFELGVVRVVRAGDVALQVESKKLGRRWVPRAALHPSSSVHGKGDRGVLRVRLCWAKKERLA